MLTPKAYRLARENLLYDLLSAAGLVGSVLPPTTLPGSKFARMGGSTWENHDLKMVADKIQDVLYRFDMVQHALGLNHPDAARFGHRPAGSTNPPTDETPPMSTKKTTAPKAPKSKAAPKSPKKPPASKPKHGGGSGYSSAGRHG